MKKLLLLVLILSLIGCTEKKMHSLELDRIDLKEAKMLDELFFEADLDSIEYILLEMTPDGESSINNILDYCVTNDYIFIHSSKKGGILQFNRSGKFIRHFAHKGDGPGETISINSISANEEKEELYISQLSTTLVYDFHGNYLKTIKISRLTSFQYYLKNNLWIETGKLFLPINYPRMIGLGIFNLDGDTIDIRNNFVNEEILSADITGIINSYLISGISNNYLSYISLSDTIFSLSSKGIEPVYEINTERTIEAKKKLSNFRSDNMIENNFLIHDFFETTDYFYVRVIYNSNMYIYSYNKTNKQTAGILSKLDPFEMMEYNRNLSLIGLKSLYNNNIPVWISKMYWDKKLLVQFNTASEILYLKENGILNNPEGEIKKVNEDSNPLIIIYHLK